MTHRTPGQLIEELLRARGWTKKVLSIVADVDESVISRIVAGKRPLDASMAIVLAEVFGIEAEQLLDLQRSFDLAQARLIARPNPARARRAHIYGGLPVSDMMKRGWINVENMRDVDGVEAQLASFFEVASPAEVVEKVLPFAAKKTNAGEPVTPIQLAWVRRVKQIAREMLTSTYSSAALPSALRQLRSLLQSAEEIRLVPRILAEAGVRFVIVESLPGAKIDGVCTWIDDSPVIGMSLRHDRIDNFWFVLRHEIEHVLRLDGKGDDQEMIDSDMESSAVGEMPAAEVVANEAAADFCVPQVQFKQFVARKAPYFRDEDIVAFARSLQVHPGLVAGQLQRNTKRYDRFRAHQVKVRAIVSSSAMVDGWGNVAPVEP